MGRNKDNFALQLLLMLTIVILMSIAVIVFFFSKTGDAHAQTPPPTSTSSSSETFKVSTVSVATSYQQVGKEVTITANITGFVVTPSSVGFKAVIQHRRSSKKKWSTYSSAPENSQFIAEPVNMSANHEFHLQSGFQNRLLIITKVGDLNHKNKKKLSRTLNWKLKPTK